MFINIDFLSVLLFYELSGKGHCVQFLFWLFIFTSVLRAVIVTISFTIYIDSRLTFQMIKRASEMHGEINGTCKMAFNIFYL